ncbi:CHAT domain-containing protein [Lentzea nigeriaca]|uniref:CHAT domain-containing protein n=1 Tax=Lentzea nigeriaca TaxID=1128665 RepID=UPI0019584D6E|nr:CHAT domain-containing protein [Lentzea nigeriaca]MBM7863435.1 tetratricopeptide (TPR) repeat protein [Lentzea nigeriaca]
MQPPIFISYSAADELFAENLGQGLESAGLRVFLDKWDVLAGQSIIGRVDEGIAAAATAIVVCSENNSDDPRVTLEYAALAKRALDGRLRRLVPVLSHNEARLPPVLSAWQAYNFAEAVDLASFNALITGLVAELTSDRVRPADLSLVVPADRARTANSPLWTTIRIRPSTTALATDDTEISAAHRGLTERVRHAWWELGRARTTAGRVLRSDAAQAARERDLDATTRAFGTTLAEAFLPASVSKALADRLRESARSGRPAHIALDVSAGLADLPWESLVLDGEPLALRPGVSVYRHQPGLGPTARTDVPGPLRVLAVIASPDTGGGELLDYEYELARILDQVHRARRHRAHVRILNWGSVDAIREALKEDFHVLHISCHARPGALVLETTDGRAEELTTWRFVDELIEPGRVVPFVVLAGCATAQSAASMPGLAQGLIEHGVPAVLAMTASVTDDYATEFLSRVYGELASQEAPDPLAAVSAVRRLIDAERRFTEWATPALFQRVRQHRLFDPGHVAPVDDQARAVLAKGIVDLGIGDFVGRRAELRELLRQLREVRGVVIHGMGGAGKSTLAAALVHLLGESRPIVPVTLHGRCTPDQVLKELARALRWHKVPREDTAFLLDQSEPWRDRLDELDRYVLPRLEAEIVLLLDDPASDPHSDELPDFVPEWLELRSPARLIMTTRVPPRHRELVTHHLGPLSLAETRKLIYRLPALDRLPPDDAQRAYQAVGGHPRALEYLDAVLRGGRRDTAERGSGAHFDTVVRRIERLTPDARWWQDGERGLDSAIAATVTIAAADVLLKDLCAGLAESAPSAAELLVAASVYRQPVEVQGLAWVVAADVVPEPAVRDRLATAYALLCEAERHGTARSRADLPLPDRVHAQLNTDLSTMRPFVRPELTEACAELMRLTLLTPVGDEFMVHRWTADALAELARPDQIVAAHRRAAAYHRRQAELWRSDLVVSLTSLEEARHHSWAAGLTGQAIAISAEMCAVLDRIGALDWEWHLCAETLALIGADDPRARPFHHRTSVVELRRGQFGAAHAAQLRAQQLAESSGDLVAVAAGLQQLGTIAHVAHDPDAAEAAYREAIKVAGDARISEQLDARTVLAGCYQRLGGLALARSDEEEAHFFSHGALDVAAEIGEETDSVTIHADLAELAHACGEHAAAERHELRAQEVSAADVDVRRVFAAALLQLGAVHVARRLFDQAWDCFVDARDHAETLEDAGLLATCVQLQGEALLQLGKLTDAREAYEYFIELAEDLDDQRGQAVAHQQLGRIWAAQGDLRGARESLRRSVEMDPVLEGTSQLVLGGVLAKAGLLEEAADVLERGLAASTDLLAMGFVIQLALVRLRREDIAGAEELFERGIDKAQELNSRRGGAVCMLALGMIARSRNRPDDAEDWYDAVMEVAADDPRLVSEALLRKGDLEFEHGNPAGAMKFYDECTDKLAGIVAPDLVAELFRQTGRCFAELGEHGEAVANLALAEETFGELGRRSEVLTTLVSLAWVLAAGGWHRSATAVMRGAGRVAEELPPSVSVVVSLLLAGDGALADGDLHEAWERYDDARRMAFDTGVRSLLADCRLHLALVAARMGQDSPGDFAAALAICERQKDPMLAMYVHWAWGRTLGDRGHLADAGALADDLHVPAVADSVDSLLDGESVPALDRRVRAELTALLWLRRRRASDGESASGDRFVARVGPAIDDVVRDLAPLPSGVSSVPAVVSPSV